MGASLPSHASVSIKEARAIYKMICKKNNINCPKVQVVTKDFKNKDNKLVKHNWVNGFTGKTGIWVLEGDFKELNKAEFAHLLGHELAHWQAFDAWYRLPGTFQEDRADYYGAIYAEKIGFNKCDQAQLYKYYQQNGYGLEPDGKHSNNLVRYKHLCP